MKGFFRHVKVMLPGLVSDSAFWDGFAWHGAARVSPLALRQTGEHRQPAGMVDHQCPSVFIGGRAAVRRPSGGEFRSQIAECRMGTGLGRDVQADPRDAGATRAVLPCAQCIPWLMPLNENIEPRTRNIELRTAEAAQAPAGPLISVHERGSAVPRQLRVGRQVEVHLVVAPVSLRPG